MLRSRIQYILTWVSFVVLMACSTLLVAIAWNSRITGGVSPTPLTLLWIGISISGIYLFMLAVKKAHRQWINEKRELEKEAREAKRKSSDPKSSSQEKKALDFAAVARKMVRRVPENSNIAQEQLGMLLLKNLARELEIMSGIYYVEKRGKFLAEATYASAVTIEPHTFKSGEGLPGQVAKNQQLMILTSLPQDYLEVHSGLGKAPPNYLAIVPLVHKGKTRAVLECSGYRYEPGDIENMFKIFARDLMDKLSLNLS
jgi:two-component system chemotaxis sensor kinase CheA